MISYYSVTESSPLKVLEKLTQLFHKHEWEEKETSPSHPVHDMERREYDCNKCHDGKVVYRIL